MRPSNAIRTTLGILGGGQLGMMLARAARRMGMTTVVWDPDVDAPGLRDADVPIVVPYADPAGVARMATLCDVITYEFEHLPAGVVTELEAMADVRPSSNLLRVCQDRWLEKETLERAGLPIAPHRKAPRAADLPAAVSALGMPVVVKTVHAGYDGKGQAVLRSAEDVRGCMLAMGDDAPPLVVEKFVALQAECSVVVVRSTSGEIVTFPVARNVHRGNILHSTQVPSNLAASTVAEAEAAGRTIAEQLRLVGILCVEMFIDTDGRLLINELAPRPHNSGHYTIEACDLSQFEALARVAAGLPVPPPRLLAPAAMVNLVGVDLDARLREEILGVPGASLHWYGKKRNAPGRKMGHVTIVGNHEADVANALTRVESFVRHAWERSAWTGVDAPSGGVPSRSE